MSTNLITSTTEPAPAATLRRGVFHSLADWWHEHLALRLIFVIGLQICVMALAISLVFWLLPGIQILQWSPVAFLMMGAFLVAGVLILRPILVCLTGRLLIETMGLFYIPINFLVFYRIYRVQPNLWQVSEPVWLWLLIASVMIGLIATLLEAALGLDRINIDAFGQGRLVWRVLNVLPTPRRSMIIENWRLNEVHDMLWRYGLDIAASRTPLRFVRHWVGRLILRDSDQFEQLSTPAKVRMMLQQLGPTYVKFGQMAASQGGSLPREWSDEMAKLQSKAAPFPFEQARKIIETELGKPINELYATFEDVPFAAASTAQVHRATLFDGSRVAVKVQRPNIINQTKADLGVMQQIADMLNRRFRFARSLDLSGMLAEFSEGVLEELDYTIEAYHAQRLEHNLREFDNVCVPDIYSSHSTSKLLTMAMIQGVKATDVAVLDARVLDRDALAESFIRALIKQVLFDGFFHGDPHPGNVLINTETGMVIFIDCGLIGELTQTQRFDLIDLMWSLQQSDIDSMINVIYRLCKQTEKVDMVKYRAGMERLIYRHVIYNTQLGENTRSAFGKLMNVVLNSLYEFGLRMDSSLTLAIKAMIQAEEVAHKISPNLDLVMVVIKMSERMVREQVTPEKVGRALKSEALSVGKEVLRRLPGLKAASMNALDSLTGDGLELKLDTSGLSKQMQQLNAIHQRFVVGLVVAGLIIGSAIVVTALFQFSTWTVVPVLPVAATIAFVAVVAFSLIALWRIMRPDLRE